jgi:4-alpha-glucanotransferase
MPPLFPRSTGVLLHPTALPGPHGMGDFGPCAYQFVDWLHRAHQHYWQILPLMPVGEGQSPYSSVSAFAGNPWLIALEPFIEKGWLTLENPPAFSTDTIDYERVIPWRSRQLSLAWQGFQAHADLADRALFDQYCRDEAFWLEDFTLFMAISDWHGRDGSWRPWTKWDKPLAWRNPQALVSFREQHAEAIQVYAWQQWCFNGQWQALRNYAQQRGVAIIGDLPIFVAHHSADCWARPDLFLLDDSGEPTVVAGVPPDAFSTVGQRWGNPLYRWDAFSREKFSWWIARIERQLKLADVIRIDHFRGFAGYWEIPAHEATAMHGRWVSAPGQALFEAVHRELGALPIIAEDLGIITPDVEALRDAFNLPGMKIAQFAFGGDHQHAYLPHHYPVNCVAYTGTHDNDTTVGWWHKLPSHEQQWVMRYLGIGEFPDDATLVKTLFQALCKSPAHTVILPLQDILMLDSTARMNTPNQLGAWRFRAPAYTDKGYEQAVAWLTQINDETHRNAQETP